MLERRRVRKKIYVTDAGDERECDLLGLAVLSAANMGRISVQIWTPNLPCARRSPK